MRGSIERRVLADGTLSYRAKVTIGVDASTGRRLTDGRTFRTRRAAEAWLNSVIDDIQAGSYVRECRTPLAEHLAHWLATHDMAPSTRRRYETVARLYVIPVLGAVPLGRLTGRQVQELYNAASGCSWASQLQAVVRGALALAVREGLVARNVAAGLAVPRAPAPDEAPPPAVWTPAELATFLHCMEETRPDYYPLYRLAAYGGLRLGELIALGWADVSLDLGRLFVRRSKSAAGRRTVELDRGTVAVLRALRAEQAGRLKRLGVTPERVFERGDGRPLAPRTVEAIMGKAVRDLGLPWATPHSLRHLMATFLASAGVAPTVIQQRMGHASFSLTASTYIHHGSVESRRAADVLAEVVERAAAGS